LIEMAKREKRSLHAQLLWILRQAVDEERAATAKGGLRRPQRRVGPLAFVTKLPLLGMIEAYAQQALAR